MKPKLYREQPDFEMSHKWLTEEAYSEALESFVVVAADVVFITTTHSKTFLLPFRKAKPMKDSFWFVGGRVNVGETEADAINRIVTRETGLLLPLERFAFITMNRYFFKDRQQKPQTKGYDCLSYVFTATLSIEERDSAAKNLDPNEYDVSIGLRSFDLPALEAAHTHAAITDLHSLLFP